ncbi:MAG: protein-L-isoaspartate(D-aspartate) O-methyltransferase, partial [Gammaproteobacteria bacterium]|nr:protein-L-isoaspartate(D-aspartate) O-methyltransferase [Gammaproteobacteria bacterium]
MLDYSELREQMVEQQIEARGVRSEILLTAMRKIPREQFIPPHMREFAYDDTPLPIAAQQTISQPYIVAYMTEGLALQGGEKVLEIGTGSGYAAAVLAEIAGKVYTIERIGELATEAASTLARLGYSNVEVINADGTLGLPGQAPFDAIVVAAGGPEVPESLKKQLKIGGRLVIPIGRYRDVQELVRVTRLSTSEFRQEDLADVRFVPLLGEEGWKPEEEAVEVTTRRATGIVTGASELEDLIRDNCEPFTSVETADLEPLLERIGRSDIVLIGEASHGTSEFYKLRSRITRELIVKKNFNFVAIEGDWPDAARIDHFVRHFDT